MFFFFFWRRLVRHPWRSNGEALLPEVHGRLHPQIFQASPHRRSLFWNRVPSHVVHGAPRVSSKATSQPVCAKVCWLWCYFLALTVANANMPLNIEMHFNIYFEHFIVTFFIVSGYMVSKFTQWLINSNFRLHQVSRAPWRQFARTLLRQKLWTLHGCLLLIWSNGLYNPSECPYSLPTSVLIDIFRFQCFFSFSERLIQSIRLVCLYQTWNNPPTVRLIQCFT